MTFCLWRCLKQLFKYLGISLLNDFVLSHVWWHQSSIYAGLDLFFSGGPPIWESHVGNRISAGLCGMFLQRVRCMPVFVQKMEPELQNWCSRGGELGEYAVAVDESFLLFLAATRAFIQNPCFDPCIYSPPNTTPLCSRYVHL